MTRILLTNDDGIGSAGLTSLRRALEPLGDVVTIAPMRNASGVGRAISIHRPLRLERVSFGDGFDGFAVDGTPVDCVRIALLGVVTPRPEVVVSGVNGGSNMGNDVTYSGTVGAALEAALHGMTGMAVSVDSRRPGHLESIEPIIESIAKRALPALLPGGMVLNVNFPDRPAGELRGVKVTGLGGSSCHDRLVLQGDDGLSGEHTIVCDRNPTGFSESDDFSAVADGYVSLTALHYDLTSRTGLLTLSDLSFDDLFDAVGSVGG